MRFTRFWKIIHVRMIVSWITTQRVQILMHKVNKQWRLRIVELLNMWFFDYWFSLIVIFVDFILNSPSSFEKNTATKVRMIGFGSLIVSIFNALFFIHTGFDRRVKFLCSCSVDTLIWKMCVKIDGWQLHLNEILLIQNYY